MIERNLPVTSAEVINVIATLSYRGSGNDGDPLRGVYQYWSFDGRLLAEHDTLHEADAPISVERPRP